MTRGLPTARPRQAGASAIMVLRAETPQERELYDLFKRLTPAQRERFLAALRQFVAGRGDTWGGPSPFSVGD